MKSKNCGILFVLKAKGSSCPLLARCLAKTGGANYITVPHPKFWGTRLPVPPPWSTPLAQATVQTAYCPVFLSHSCRFIHYSHGIMTVHQFHHHQFNCLLFLFHSTLLVKPTFSTKPSHWVAFSDSQTVFQISDVHRFVLISFYCLFKVFVWSCALIITSFKRLIKGSNLSPFVYYS